MVTMTEEEASFEDCMDDAIEAIKDAMSRLDLGYALCPSCKSKRYHNFVDKKEGDTLANSLTRLETIREAHKRRGW